MNEDTSSIHEKVGKLSGTVIAQGDRITELKEDMVSGFSELKSDNAELRSESAEIKEIVSQLKGGWKVLIFMSSAAGAIGGLLIKFAGKIL
jgi:hypothetical protein